MIGRPDLIRQRAPKEEREGGVQIPENNTATPQHPCGCTLAAYAEAKRLNVDTLRSFGISEMYYLSQPAVRIPYYSADGRRRLFASASHSMARTNFDGERATKHSFMG